MQSVRQSTLRTCSRLDPVQGDAVQALERARNFTFKCDTAERGDGDGAKYTMQESSQTTHEGIAALGDTRAQVCEGPCQARIKHER